MKIVYIVKYIAQLGGLDRVLSYKMNYMSKQPGNKVYLITYEQGDHPISFPLSEEIEHTDLNVRFFTRHKYGLTKRLILYFQMRKTFKDRLNQEIAKINPDIIITLTDSYTLLDILMNLNTEAKIIVESHVERDGTIKSTDYLHNRWMHLITSAYDNYILNNLKRCDAFVTLTQEDANKWTGISNKYIIPNPISVTPKATSTLDNKKVISVGRLEPQKGYDMLIEAWNKVSKKHPDWQLDIYGDGGLHNSFEKQIKELGITNSCHLQPATKDIYDKYIESSIYVMSSRYEGFGLVLVEAMSCGVPCVSFNCPHGPADIIKNKEDGILVEPDNIQKLADAICFLIENEDKRKEYGSKAKENVKRFYPELIMPQWTGLFESLVKS